MGIDGTGQWPNCMWIPPPLLFFFFQILYLPNCLQAEFEAPNELLKKEGSLFKALVDESGDKAALYAMAELNATSFE